MEPDWKLTPRQWEVLKLMSKGFTNPEIADLLQISLGTVKAHVGAIIAELDVTNRTEAAVLYQETLAPADPSLETGDQASTINLVVLPFSDHSPSQAHQYFADGLSEELMCTLGRHTGFRLVARTTAFALKQHNLSSQEIGERLQVWGLLEGSISIIDDDLRVNIQLVEANSGYMHWSEVYRTKISNIIQVQQQIIGALVQTLEHKLGTQKTVEPAAHIPTFEVYQQYLLGRSFWHQRSPAGIMQAIGCFQKAVQADDAYALAYVGLADAYNQIAYYAPSPPKALFEQSQQFLQRALATEPNLAEALASQGYVDIHHHRNFASAESHLQQAILANPSYTYGYGWLSLLKIIQGQFDLALEYAEKGQALDALSPAYVAHIGNIQRCMGDHDAAIQSYEKAIQSDLKDPKSLLTYALSLVEVGRIDDAKKIGERLYAGFKDQAGGLGAYGHIMALCSQLDKAREMLEALQEKKDAGYCSAMPRVWVYLGLGENDKAMQALQHAIDEHEPLSLYVNTEPAFAPLWSHADYPAQIEKLNLQARLDVALTN